MPTTAETSQVKRLLSDLLLIGGEQNSNKRLRVRFDDKVEMHSSDKSGEEYDSLSNEEHDEDEEVDFVLSIGEDGDWDYTITIPPAPAEEFKADSSQCKNSRPASPFAGCELCEELYMMDEGPLLRVDSNSSLGNNLKISLKACNDNHHFDATSAAAAMPMPLITPPSSPRRVRTFSCDGVTTEEATICEWPYNLTVDNAITSALESAPLSLPLGSSCAER